MPKWTPSDRLRWATSVRRDPRFAAVEHSIASELANRANARGSTWISKSRLASDLAYSPRTIQRGISKLRKLGYLSAKLRRGFSSIHTLTNPEDSTVSSSGQTRPAPQDVAVSQTYFEPKNHQPNPFQSPIARGHIKSRSISEISLAQKLGSDGFRILERLKYWQVARLVKKLEEGNLAAEDLMLAKKWAAEA